MAPMVSLYSVGKATCIMSIIHPETVGSHMPYKAIRIQNSVGLLSLCQSRSSGTVDG